MFAAYGLAFWYGATLINNNEITAGETVTVFFGTFRSAPLFPFTVAVSLTCSRCSPLQGHPSAAVIFGAFGLGQAAPSLQAFAVASGAAVKVFETIDRQPLIDTLSEEGSRPESVRGDITFESIYFRYPSRPDVPILRGLNLTIKSGQTVALVGPSGCGKSTTVGLLERFYDPDSGVVRLDGTDIRTV